MTRETSRKPKAPAKPNVPAKPRTVVKPKATSARRRAAPAPAPLPAHRESAVCLAVLSDPALHTDMLSRSPIVAGAAAPVSSGSLAAPATGSVPAFLRRDEANAPGFAKGEVAPAIDRPAAIVALASLMDQRRAVSASDRYMLDHGVSLEEITRLREEEARICAEIEGARAAPSSEDGAPRPRVTKTAGFKWLIDTATNPNREGSQRWDGFALLRDCADLGEFYTKGGKPDFIRWALHKKWIEVQG